MTFGDGRVALACRPGGATSSRATASAPAPRLRPRARSPSSPSRCPGCRPVENPVAASGGADAEAAESLRTFAPRSALLLGRAVSIPDIEAVAAAVPGVARRARRMALARRAPAPGRTGLVRRLARASRRTISAAPARHVRSVAADRCGAGDRRCRRCSSSTSSPTRAGCRPRSLSTVRSRAHGPGARSPRSRANRHRRAAVPQPHLRRRRRRAGCPWRALAARSAERASAGFAVTPGAGKYFDFEQGGLGLSGGELAGE